MTTTGSGAAPASDQAYLQSIYPYASQAASQLGVPVSAVLAQSALETGWGTSNAWQNLNNPAGINVAGAATGENYAAYSSPAAGYAAYANLVASQYPGAVGASTPYQYANALAAGGWATDPYYASKIDAIANGPTIQGFLGGVA